MSQETEIWSACPLEDYRAPSEPTTEVVRKGFRYLWRRIRNKKKLAPKVDAELQRAKSDAEDRLCPEWDYEKAGGALESALADWLQQGGGVRTVVGAPHSGTEAAVRKLAERLKFRVLEAPPRNQLSNSSVEWPESCEKALAQGRVVIPRLERWFLRHADGFDWLRALFERLSNYSGHCLVHCQSWAWTYLKEPLCPESVLAHPLTFAPMTTERLQLWLRPALDRFDSEPLLLLRADNGHPLWRSDDPSSNQASGLEELLHHVSGRSRGLADLSREIWRECLRRRPADSGVAASSTHPKSHVVWVTPWSHLSLPTIPTWIERQEEFVLDSLLLHGGLDAASLAQILSVPTSQVNRWLLRLQHAGLIRLDQDEWNVECLAYPAVREHLGGEGFQTDGL